ncbi:hypothetical protein X768_33880 [Mesorhizobium sp. LSJC265A00]|nr:hypothetical protein X768_33880 [Mesorhizobium sp. LSJC265A00]
MLVGGSTPSLKESATMVPTVPNQLPNTRAVLGHNQPPESSVAKQLNGIERAIGTYEDLRNDGLRLCIVQATSVAQEIRQGGPRAWADFINEPKWGDNAPPSNGKKYLYHVFRWIFGLGGAAAKNASLYSRAVQALLNEGVEVEELEEHLKRSTLKKLAATGASSKREKKKIVGHRTRPSKPNSPSNKATCQSKLDSKIANKPEASKADTPTTTRAHYDGSIKVEFVGNTQPFLGLERNKDFILRARVISLGNPFKIAINEAFLDPDPRD